MPLGSWRVVTEPQKAQCCKWKALFLHILMHWKPFLKKPAPQLITFTSTGQMPAANTRSQCTGWISSSRYHQCKSSRMLSHVQIFALSPAWRSMSWSKVYHHVFFTSITHWRYLVELYGDLDLCSWGMSFLEQIRQVTMAVLSAPTHWILHHL